MLSFRMSIIPWWMSSLPVVQFRIPRSRTAIAARAGRVLCSLVSVSSEDVEVAFLFLECQDSGHKASVYFLDYFFRPKSLFFFFLLCHVDVDGTPHYSAESAYRL